MQGISLLSVQGNQENDHPARQFLFESGDVNGLFIPDLFKWESCSHSSPIDVMAVLRNGLSCSRPSSQWWSHVSQADLSHALCLVLNETQIYGCNQRHGTPPPPSSSVHCTGKKGDFKSNVTYTKWICTPSVSSVVLRRFQLYSAEASESVTVWFLALF